MGAKSSTERRHHLESAHRHRAVGSAGAASRPEDRLCSTDDLPGDRTRRSTGACGGAGARSLAQGVPVETIVTLRPEFGWPPVLHAQPNQSAGRGWCGPRGRVPRAHDRPVQGAPAAPEQVPARQPSGHARRGEARRCAADGRGLQPRPASERRTLNLSRGSGAFWNTTTRCNGFDRT